MSQDLCKGPQSSSCTKSPAVTKARNVLHLQEAASTSRMRMFCTASLALQEHRDLSDSVNTKRCAIYCILTTTSPPNWHKMQVRLNVCFLCCFFYRHSLKNTWIFFCFFLKGADLIWTQDFMSLIIQMIAAWRRHSIVKEKKNLL